MQILSLKPYDDLDWDMISSWWTSYGYNPVPADLLKGCTWIGHIDGRPVMSVTLYLTDSPMAYLENFVANPDASREDRDTMVKWGLEVISGWAKSAGKRYFWAHPNSRALARYYNRRLGFQTMQEGLTSMARTI